MDLRVKHIFDQEMKGDKSFTETEKGFFSFGPPSYRQSEVRRIWHAGIKHGIEIGLRRASPQGQAVELNANTPEGKGKEFLEKFYKLAQEYQCEITYHPVLGMIVRERFHRDF